MMVSLLCLELMRALIILSLIGSHSRKVLAFSLEITRATPRMCVSLCPDDRMVGPSGVTCALDPVHRHSLTPGISSLYLFISPMYCANFDVSFMVRSADIPGPYADFGLGPNLSQPWLPGVGFEQMWSYCQMSGSSPLWSSLVVVVIVVVSVAILVFTGWGCQPPTPNLRSARLR